MMPSQSECRASAQAEVQTDDQPMRLADTQRCQWLMLYFALGSSSHALPWLLGSGGRSANQIKSKVLSNCVIRLWEKQPVVPVSKSAACYVVRDTRVTSITVTKPNFKQIFDTVSYTYVRLHVLYALATCP